MAINVWDECAACAPKHVEVIGGVCPKHGAVSDVVPCFEVRDIHGEWIEFRNGVEQRKRRAVNYYLFEREFEREPFTDWPNGQGVYE